MLYLMLNRYWLGAFLAVYKKNVKKQDSKGFWRFNACSLSKKKVPSERDFFY